MPNSPLLEINSDVLNTIEEKLSVLSDEEKDALLDAFEPRFEQFMSDQAEGFAATRCLA